MIEYRPWALDELDRAISLYKEGIYSILDIELGGGCNLTCIYCDTPDRTTTEQIDIPNIESFFKLKKVRWLFICGLGEPTVKSNSSKFIEILKLCRKYGIKCSSFTNLVEFDKSIIEFMNDGILHILFKLDSFSIEKTEKLYGSKNASKINENIKHLERCVKVVGSTTNVAASIVPTTENYEEICSIFDYCLSKSIFPLIADLEYSGMPTKVYRALKLPNELLIKLRKDIEMNFKINYQNPVCPSVIGGIHIDHENNIIVDEQTGLSCHWFWLKKPKVKIIGNMNKFENYDEICTAISNYRNNRLSDVRRIIKRKLSLTFGGCGGDITFMLDKYLKVQKKFFD